MFKAMVQGFWRVVTSPGLILWLWLVSFAFALPSAWVMKDAIRSSVGASLVADKLRESFDAGWYEEFEAQARGLEKSFTPTVIGAGGFYNNMEAWLNGDLFKASPALVGLGVLYALVWALFLGGVLDRFSGVTGRFHLGAFLSAGGKFFFRFVRLAVLSGVFYYLLIGRFSPWWFGWIERATKDVAVEESVLVATLAGAALVVFLMTFVNLVFDYAKIFAFRESRRSMLLAAARGLRFVLSYPVKTMGLYYCLGVLGLVLLAVYASIAPGANQSTAAGVAAAFLVGQALLVLRLIVRLWFYGGQMALYENLTGASRRSSAAG